MAITDNDIKQLAQLANLAPDPTLTSALQTDLEKMVSLIKELQAVDTQNVAPMTHPLANYRQPNDHLRDDVPAPVNSPQQRDALMHNALAKTDGLFLVPTVIE